MLAYAQSYSNTDGKIAFQYLNGDTGEAIAGNDINSTELVILHDFDENISYAFSDTSSTTVLDHQEGFAEDPIFPDPDEPETILPFQVLFKPTVQLGGDRNSLLLSNFENTLIGGINNLGNQQYLAVWLQNEIIRDNNGGQSFLGFPEVYNFIDPEWIGNGLLSVLADTQFPEPNFETILEGTPLVIEIPILDDEGNQAVDDNGVPVPPLIRSFVPPLYPNPIPLFVSSIREGTTITSQVTPNYNYLKTEVYDFRHSLSGDSLTPMPLFPGTFCGFGTPATTIFFNRETGMDYLRQVDEELKGFSEVWLNNLVFSGERTQTFKETYLYDQTDASDLVVVGFDEETQQDIYTRVVILFYVIDETTGESIPVYAPKFSTQALFLCIEFAAGIFAWSPAVTRSGLFRGELHTTDRDYERKIIEPEWLAPITLNYGRNKKHFRTEVGKEDNLLTIPVTEWEINPFDTGFTFPIICIENKLIIINTDEDLISPKTLLISGDGVSALFTERTYLLEQEFKIDADTEYTRFNDIESYQLNPLYTSEDILDGEGEIIGNTETANNAFKNIETTTVTTEEESNKFYLVIGDQTTEIDTDSSWMFSVISDVELGLGTFTLSNDNEENPIFEAPINVITSYIKVRDVVQESLYENSETLGNANSTIFSNVVEQEVLFWETVDQESVFIQTGEFRYRGLVIDYDFEDNPTEGFPIEKTRKVNSITIQIESVETYPQGLAETGEILIYPDSNCSVLLRDRLLSSQNKRYCNLVGNTLYFAKSVEFDPLATNQFTETYIIGLTVTQELPESGGFVPINSVETVLGISYFPVG